MKCRCGASSHLWNKACGDWEDEVKGGKYV